MLIPVVFGPTAAGKSSVAFALARRQPITIIVADSRQIYRGFDIGTAKPDAAEQAAVPHRGIDLIQPTDRYSAAAWAERADGWIEEARAAGRIPLVVGGTGFYLRALFEPLFDEPELDPRARRQLEMVLASLSVDELRRWCLALDPERAHLGRAQLLRAIEVALISGERLSDLHRLRARPARRLARYLVVDPGPALAGRIEARLDAMLDGGWVDEVRGLIETVPADAPAWNATGYRAVRELVSGTIDRGTARQRILIATRQYAKRQRTWIRHQVEESAVTRLDPADPSAALAERWLLASTEGRA
ncbi:MAG TPA: tRNA (adenosine(37)-N6)-dimethylallyltransferase MiaA [Gemmatimonadaceae bacterium]|nr:tRNA (adenosine(37)-N6)-dimethylallyltransferase MiaA [Gemmatimonadaceae bacterium]